MAKPSWDEVKARLARATDDGAAAVRAQAALEARARALAHPPEAERTARLAALALDAGEGRYALVGEGLWRVERAGAPARLPAAPPALLGLVALQGRALPLLDLPALLGAGAPRQDPAPWAVVLGRARPALAFAADRVALVEIAREALHPPLAGGADGLRLGLDAEARLVLDAAALVERGRAALAESAR